MNDRIINLFGLYNDMIVNHNIDKAFLLNYIDNEEDRKLIIKNLKSFYIIGKINYRNSNIKSFIDTNYFYEEILITFLELKEKTNLNKAHSIIQRIIPNPIINISKEGCRISISSANKRINKNEFNKVIVENIFISNIIDIDYTKSVDKDFLNSLNISFLDELNNNDTINNCNLFDFYNIYIEKIDICKVIDIIGIYPKNHLNYEYINKLIEQLNVIKQEKRELENSFKKATKLKDKIELNKKISKVNEKYDYVMKQIKELCY